jgi:hypothetical protein
MSPEAEEAYMKAMNLFPPVKPGNYINSFSRIVQSRETEFRVIFCLIIGISHMWTINDALWGFFLLNKKCYRSPSHQRPPFLSGQISVALR